MIWYEHLLCECGGTIGQFNNVYKILECEKCHKEYDWNEIKYDVIYKNVYTGWLFPVLYKKELAE